MKRWILIGMVVASGMTIQAQNKLPEKFPYQDTSLTAEERADDLLKRLTLEEKASLMMNGSPAIPRLSIKAYGWWNEALHGLARTGLATVFPQAIGMGASFDDSLLYEVFTAVSDEARAKSRRLDSKGNLTRYQALTVWTPNVNIFRDPRWGRGQETYGEDPYLTSRLGVAVVNGLQGPDTARYNKLHACAKHYAVHSGPEWNRHSFNAENISPRDLWETYLPAFEALVTQADVEAVMGAYNRTNEEPCCAHSYLMEEVLRDKWHFEGHYVSDCWAIRDFHEGHHVTAFPEDSAALALEKGCDLNCGCTYEYILQAYKQGKVTEEEIRRSAERLFTTRYLLGLFDHSSLDEIPYNVVGCKEHRELAYQAAVESCVLLKNDGTLPLSLKDNKRMAVIGPNADSHAALVGNYNGTPPRSITVVEGITRICEDTGWDVNYAEGCLLYDDPSVRKVFQNYRIPEAVALAESCDLAIVCVGLDSTLEGEQGDVGNAFASGDKPDLLLPKIQRDLVEQVIATGTPVILIDLAGSPIDLSAYEDQVPAILHAWYPGGEGGRAIADILFGKVSPGGKLPLTFYYNDGPLPDITDYHMTGRTYRYFEGRPWKPFGFGLTYGELQITEAKVTEVDYTKEIPSAQITIHCQNPTDRDLSDVIQVYVHVNGSSNEVPNHKLAAFERIRLDAGESKEFRITIPPMAFTTVDNSGNRVFDGTSATLYLGFSQPDLTEEDQKIYTGNRGQVFAVTL